MCSDTKKIQQQAKVGAAAAAANVNPVKQPTPAQKVLASTLNLKKGVRQAAGSGQNRGRDGSNSSRESGFQAPNKPDRHSNDRGSMDPILTTLRQLKKPSSGTNTGASLPTPANSTRFVGSRNGRVGAGRLDNIQAQRRQRASKTLGF